MHSNTCVLLLGFAGTGKLTIAQVLAPIIGARIVDNHWINNPIFGLVETDRQTPLPASIWDQTQKVREAVLDTIATLSRPNSSFIFTYVGIDGDPYDRHSYELMQRAADKRNALFVPVRLICSEEGLARRIIMPERKEKLKETNALAAIMRNRALKILDPKHINQMTLDVSHISAIEAAEAIERHISGLRKRQAG